MVQGLGFRLLRCVAVGVSVGGGVMGVLAGAARAEPFARRPYAQSVSTDEVVLKWTQGTGGALLRYGPAGADREAAAEEVVFREAASPTGEHELRLTGLRHSTRYQYSVDATDGSDDGWGRGAAVALGEFSTAVLRDEPFSFLLYGDNRSSEPDHRRVVEAMARESADFVLNTGDIVEHGSAAEYDGFFRVEAPLLARVVLFPTLGNHELSFGLGAGAWEHAFVTPSTTSGTRRYYSFDYGNSRFGTAEIAEVA